MRTLPVARLGTAGASHSILYFRKSEVSQVQSSLNPKMTQDWSEGGANHGPPSFSDSVLFLCGLAGAACGFGPQPLDLAPGQRHADLSDPVQFHPHDRLGVEAGEIDHCRRFSTLDGLQIALAGFQAHGGFFAVETPQRMALLPVDHDNVAVFVFWQHGITRHLKGNGFLRNRERQFDLSQTLRRQLLVLRLDNRSSADAAHDRHRIQLEVSDDKLNLRSLDQANFGKYLGNRARPHAHGRSQTALGLARLLKSPLDRFDIQHGHYLSELQNEVNSGFQKYRLT